MISIYISNYFNIFHPDKLFMSKFPGLAIVGQVLENALVAHRRKVPQNSAANWFIFPLGAWERDETNLKLSD